MTLTQVGRTAILEQQNKQLRRSLRAIRETDRLLRLDLQNAVEAKSEAARRSEERIEERDRHIEDLEKRLHGYEAEANSNRSRIKQLERDLATAMSLLGNLTRAIDSTPVRLVLADVQFDHAEPATLPESPAAREKRKSSRMVDEAIRCIGNTIDTNLMSLAAKSAAERSED